MPIFKSDNKELTPVQQAVFAGDPAALTQLIAGAPIDVNETGSEGIPLVYLAAREGHLKMVKFLVESGADVNAVRLKNGRTALHAAVDKGHAKIAQYLLEHGAKPHKQSLTPLTGKQQVAYEAAAAELQQAMAAGGDITEQQAELAKALEGTRLWRNPEGEYRPYNMGPTASELASSSRKLKRVFKNHEIEREVSAKMLLRLAQKASSGDSPFVEPNEEMQQCIRIADFSVKDVFDKTLMDYAVDHQDEALAKILADAGVRPSEAVIQRLRAEGLKDLAKILLPSQAAAGLLFDTADAELLAYVQAGDEQAVLGCLQQLKAKVEQDPSFKAPEQAYQALGRMLDRTTPEGETVLSIAARNGQLGIVTLLLQHRASPLQPVLERGDDGVRVFTMDAPNAYDLAIEAGHKPVAQAILVHAAKQSVANVLLPSLARTRYSNDGGVNSTRAKAAADVYDTESGWNLLHFIADRRGLKTGVERTVKQYAALGLDVNAAAKNGDTPLHVAARAGNRYAVKALLAVDGIDKDKTNADGLTAVQLSEQLSSRRQQVEAPADAVESDYAGLSPVPDSAAGSVAEAAESDYSGLSPVPDSLAEAAESNYAGLPSAPDSAIDEPGAEYESMPGDATMRDRSLTAPAPTAAVDLPSATGRRLRGSTTGSTDDAGKEYASVEGFRMLSEGLADPRLNPTVDKEQDHVDQRDLKSPPSSAYGEQARPQGIVTVTPVVAEKEAKPSLLKRLVTFIFGGGSSKQTQVPTLGQEQARAPLQRTETQYTSFKDAQANTAEQQHLFRAKLINPVIVELAEQQGLNLAVRDKLDATPEIKLERLNNVILDNKPRTDMHVKAMLSTIGLKVTPEQLQAVQAKNAELREALAKDNLQDNAIWARIANYAKANPGKTAATAVGAVVAVKLLPVALAFVGLKGFAAWAGHHVAAALAIKTTAGVAGAAGAKKASSSIDRVIHEAGEQELQQGIGDKPADYDASKAEEAEAADDDDDDYSDDYDGLPPPSP